MMRPIKVRSDWGYYDALDGLDLRDGERLRIEWPDGTVSEETIQVEHCTLDSREHIGETRATVTVMHCGAPAQVQLREIKTLLAERI